MLEPKKLLNHHAEFVAHLSAKGGPDTEDYYELDTWICEIIDDTRSGRLRQAELNQLIESMGEAFSTATMQGLAYQKPHGYAGDYQIIDRIYQRYICPNPHLSNWDNYWQSHAAADAVRNRVQYLHNTIKGHIEKHPSHLLNVLNLASGPGRDMCEFFEKDPQAQVAFDCVEQDENAISYSKELCKDHLAHIRFFKKNVLRFHSSRKYRLIWSAGLFDYFEDKVVVFMLKKLRDMLADGGEIVIGNFSSKNPSKSYMQLFEWNLNHRSPNTLKALAAAAGFDQKQISVKKEELGVNLFLHLTPTFNAVDDEHLFRGSDKFDKIHTAIK